MVKRYQAGFMAGATAVDPFVTPETLYLTPSRDFSGFNDPKKGASAAQGLIGRGVDVIFDVTGDSGSVVRRAATKAGIGVIGADVDAARRVPKFEARAVFVSAVKCVDVAVFDFLSRFAAGKVKGGKVVYGMKNGGVCVTGNCPELDELTKKVAAGEIKVPAPAVSPSHPRAGAFSWCDTT
ncbi:BMP family ABC transporter substrate-binding protein [Nonomuraea sp. NPDC005650]|uniref:BMP family lipoprotein n=1 Tax=Nonomuraea sp. NPDC005650 TaxID=3157045 RepID=UPI0033B4ED04